MDAPKATTAFVGTLYVGTDRLGRALTNDEKADLTALLRAHDFVGASIVSLRFAFRLRRSKPAAQDLQGRANFRLVRVGWDPRVIALVKCLCRYVWSEHTHEARETAATAKAVDVYLREEGIHQGTTAPSPEERAERIEAERQEAERCRAQIEVLRAEFTKDNDKINLLWLGYMLADVTSASEMSDKSGVDVSEFYLAQERRKRLTKRLLAAKSGTKSEEDDE